MDDDKEDETKAVKKIKIDCEDKQEDMEKAEILYTLLSLHANVESLDERGYTPLFSAAECGNIRCMEILIEGGANILHRAPNSNGLLHLASSVGNPACVEFILKLSIPVDDVDNKGFTPLCIATSKGHIEIMKMLVEAGGNLHHRTLEGYTPIYYAAKNHHQETVMAIKRLGTFFTNNDITELAWRRNFVGLEIAKEAGADFSIPRLDWQNFSLLHMASCNGMNDLVLWLINGGVDVNIRDKYDWTPLHHAVRCGVFSTIELLLANNANINARVIDCRTPLSLAKLYRYIPIAEYLKANGGIQ